MLRKLYKHEFYSLYRVLVPIYCVLAGLSVISRISHEIDFGNSSFDFIKGFSTVLSTATTICIFIVGFVIVVARFYQNLLGKQGYLTFSLPFTATKHIVCKLVCGVAVTVTNVLATFLSLLIIYGGTDTGKNISKGLEFAYKEVCKTFGTEKVVIFTVEIILILLLSSFVSLLMLYTCMAIGQQFKNKIIASIIAYFCIYSAWQFIGTVFLTVSSALKFFNFDEMPDIPPFSVAQIIFAFVLVYLLIQGIIYFFVTRFFLSKKLNLE